MNVEALAIDIYAVLAKHAVQHNKPSAKRDASAWIAGVRDHRISNFCAVNMPRAYKIADEFCYASGY